MKSLDAVQREAVDKLFSRATRERSLDLVWQGTELRASNGSWGIALPAGRVPTEWVIRGDGKWASARGAALRRVDVVPFDWRRICSPEVDLGSPVGFLRLPGENGPVVVLPSTEAVDLFLRPGSAAEKWVGFRRDWVALLEVALGHPGASLSLDRNRSEWRFTARGEAILVVDHPFDGIAVVAPKDSD